MITLRPQAAPRTDRPLPCTVARDRGGALDVGETVQLEAVPAGLVTDAVFRLTTATASCWVREVGDPDAELRLFERLNQDLLRPTARR